jgi:hypothetical protein
MNPVTPKQANSLHLWCDQVAAQLNDSGIDMVSFLTILAERPTITSQWTGKAFKETCYKPVFQAIAQKDSTTEASTLDHDIVITALTRLVSLRFDGLLLPPFPDRFNQMN